MGALAAPIAGGAASALVGGLMSKGSSGGGGGYQPVGPQFGDVLPHAMPWGVNVMGLGGTMTDETGRVVGTYVDPRLQAIANNLFMRAGEQSQELMGYDFSPEAMAGVAREYSAPLMEQIREQGQLSMQDLEKRRLAQGMFGSTGMAKDVEALGKGITQQQALAAMEGQKFGLQLGQYGQRLQDLMRQREMQDIQNMMAMYNAPAQQLGLGATIGANIGGVASGIRPAMVQTPPSGGFGSGLFGTLAGPLSQYAGKAAGDWAGDYFNSPPMSQGYTDSYAGYGGWGGYIDSGMAAEDYASGVY